MDIHVITKVLTEKNVEPLQSFVLFSKYRNEIYVNNTLRFYLETSKLTERYFMKHIREEIFND